MTTPWGLPDFDAHEEVHFVTDEKCGLKAIIALHSTHLGPAAGGARFWHYAKDEEALTDALRLSRGMSYKNAMAGLPLGGGKSVILADADRTKTPDMLHAFGKAVDSLVRPLRDRRGRRHECRRHDRDCARDQVRCRTAEFGGGDVGGDPGPHTSLGVFLGIKAAVKWALGKDSLHGFTSRCRARAASRPALRCMPAPKAPGCRIADVDEAKAQKLADATGGKVVSHRRDPRPRSRCRQPVRARRDPRRAVDRRAQDAGRCGRREQPARDARGRRAAARSAASSTRPIMSSTPAASSTSAPNISAMATPAWCAGASRASRSGSSRSGPRARRPAATRRRSPTPWRSG